jgi:hypothetical protein
MSCDNFIGNFTKKGFLTPLSHKGGRRDYTKCNINRVRVRGALNNAEKGQKGRKKERRTERKKERQKDRERQPQHFYLQDLFEFNLIAMF